MSLSISLCYLSWSFRGESHNRRSRTEWLIETSSLPNSPIKWFSLSVNGSPRLYLNSLAELNARFPQIHPSCLPTLRSGDHLSVTLKPAVGPNTCHAYRHIMNGKDRLALGLKINLNHDSLSDLQAIPKVGPRMAIQIVNGRPWHSIKSLIRLRGVGKHRLKHLMSYLSLTPPPTLWRQKQVLKGGRL